MYQLRIRRKVTLYSKIFDETRCEQLCHNHRIKYIAFLSNRNIINIQLIKEFFTKIILTKISDLQSGIVLLGNSKAYKFLRSTVNIDKYISKEKEKS